VHLHQQKLDLNDVAVFDAVAAAGSFTAAARALRLPRATVSRTVARLEAALGTQLLYRTTRRVTLTGAGRRFHDTARAGLALIADAGEAAAATADEPQGLLRVTAPIIFATMSLIPWLPAFLAAHPKVQVALRLDDRAADPLAAGADVVLVTGPLPDSTHRVRRLGRSRLILTASPAYLAGRPPLETLADLARHDAVLFASERGPETWRLDGPVDVEVTGRVGVAGPFAELAAALAGLGVALLPGPVVAPYLATGRLRQVLPEHGRSGGAISAVFAANRHPPAALRAFIDFLAARMADGPPLPAVEPAPPG